MHHTPTASHKPMWFARWHNSSGCLEASSSPRGFWHSCLGPADPLCSATAVHTMLPATSANPVAPYQKCTCQSATHHLQQPTVLDSAASAQELCPQKPCLLLTEDTCQTSAATSSGSFAADKNHTGSSTISFKSAHSSPQTDLSCGTSRHCNACV